MTFREWKAEVVRELNHYESEHPESESEAVLWGKFLHHVKKEMEKN